MGRFCNWLIWKWVDFYKGSIWGDRRFKWFKRRARRGGLKRFRKFKRLKKLKRRAR
jgi:hypothetical protein